MRKIILTVLFVLALAGTAGAFDCIAATAPSFVCSWTEPTKNVDNSPLTDLSFTNVYWKIGAAAETRGANQPATSPSGGGSVTSSITVNVAANTVAVVTFRATATDASGNESGSSNVVTKTVDRLPPLPPT